MAVWEVKTTVARGYDDDLEFFPSETGVKEYRLLGVKLYRKDYKVKTKAEVIHADDKKPKRKKTIGFEK